MSDKTDALEKILEQESLFHGKYLHVERLGIQLKDGRTGDREIVRVPDAVALLPVDEDGTVHLVRQHRPAIGRTLVEIPAGLLDDGEGEEEAAVRECEEEIGYVPRKLERLISYAHAEGYSTGFITLFLGTELDYTGRFHFDASEYVEQVKMPFGELFDLVEKNEAVDSKTILSTLLCAHRFMD